MARYRKKRGKGLIIAALLAVFALAYIVASHVYSDLLNYNEAADPGDTGVYSVTIPQGASTQKIAEILHESGIIADIRKFKLKSRLSGLDGKFQAGEYSLSPSMLTEEIMALLQSGKSVTVRFTVPEGLTVKQTAEKLVSEGIVASEEDFYAACASDWDYWFLEGISASAGPGGSVPAEANRLEGFLFPETYEVYEQAPAEDVVRVMLEQFDKVFTPLYEASDKSLSVHDAATVASLIERESRIDGERDEIASVIYNRIDIGMPLQIDATVLYALGEWKDRVLYSDLEVDSPYNTYKYAGIPAGPIASAGEASLSAALEPADSDYLYYVLKADGSGEHNFAEDYETFLKYRDEYRKSVGN